MRKIDIIKTAQSPKVVLMHRINPLFGLGTPMYDYASKFEVDRQKQTLDEFQKIVKILEAVLPETEYPEGVQLSIAPLSCSYSYTIEERSKVQSRFSIGNGEMGTYISGKISNSPAGDAVYVEYGMNEKYGEEGEEYVTTTEMDKIVVVSI